jgi:hypothetical protein
MKRWAVLAAVAAIGLLASSPHPQAQGVASPGPAVDQHAQGGKDQKAQQPKQPVAPPQGDNQAKAGAAGDKQLTAYEERDLDHSGRAVQAAEESLIWVRVGTIIAGVGTVAVAATLFYTAVAAIAARKAAEAIPLLERAYVYAMIKSENISESLQLAERMRTNPMTVPCGEIPNPVAKVVFKNFGKTPATLLYGEVSMGLIGVTRFGSTTDLPIKYRYVLGEGEKSEPFTAQFSDPLTTEEAQGVNAGRYGIVVGGFMNYQDIWGREHGCPVSFSYNIALKRLDANVRPKKKPAHRGLSRLLPSHWWPRGGA